MRGVVVGLGFGNRDQLRTDRVDLGIPRRGKGNREKSGVKYTYVWHILSENGSRLGQISGDESSVAGAPNSDNWAAFTPEISERIANRAIQTLVTTSFPNSNVAMTPAR